MKKLRISMFDNDYAVQAKTQFDLNNGSASAQVFEFFEKIKEELIANQATHIEIEGIQDDALVFSIRPYA